MAAPLVQIRGLTKAYYGQRAAVHRALMIAVDLVSERNRNVYTLRVIQL